MVEPKKEKRAAAANPMRSRCLEIWIIVSIAVAWIEAAEESICFRRHAEA
jgi:hypothetical protein